MKKSQLVIAAAALTGALAIAAPSFGQAAPSNPVPGKGQPAGPRNPRPGKKLGPQDGSGPIHLPGTGGGTGAGQRGPRR